ncbi:hypothetical protein EG68_09155 [Paragonimus skrjabini miyazakii]|uniref:Palmitoyltransferase n=1 Tax=Paragonimus skrjabini miyazakii TaxID=59628 RepID=A0A8S9YIL8_9TREM|nr:hypothetical protein EG68_09155 [Paragonimus skrjabini miyazakii]
MSYCGSFGRYSLAAVGFLPVGILLLIIGWSYYVFVFMLSAGLIEGLSFTIVHTVMYHVCLAFFAWTFWQSVCTPSKPVPRQYYLTALETITFIDMEKEDERWTYLEQLVTQKDLSVTLFNKHGKVPFCDICFVIKPDRTHHCSTCERCVPRMDHHCPWINNCVGFHNQKYFLLFLSYASLYCLFCFTASIPTSVQLLKATIDVTMVTLHVFLLAIVSSVFMIGLLILLVFQMHLLLTNSSTLEFYRPPSFRTLGQPGTFNLGWRRNFVEVFGNKPILWFLPVFSSKGDGYIFPTRSRESGRQTRLLVT